MSLISDLDLKLPQRWMVEKETAQSGVVTGFDHLADVALLADRYCPPPTGAVQSEPPPACLQPLPDILVLLLIGMGAGDIGNQETTVGQPPGYVSKIISHGRE